jgi:hypothetical protein
MHALGMRQRANRLPTEAKKGASGSIKSVEEYEVVLEE